MHLLNQRAPPLKGGASFGPREGAGAALETWQYESQRRSSGTSPSCGRASDGAGNGGIATPTPVPFCSRSATWPASTGCRPSNLTTDYKSVGAEATNSERLNLFGGVVASIFNLSALRIMQVMGCSPEINSPTAVEAYRSTVRPFSCPLPRPDITSVTFLRGEEVCFGDGSGAECTDSEKTSPADFVARVLASIGGVCGLELTTRTPKSQLGTLWGDVESATACGSPLPTLAAAIYDKAAGVGGLPPRTNALETRPHQRAPVYLSDEAADLSYNTWAMYSGSVIGTLLYDVVDAAGSYNGTEWHVLENGRVEIVSPGGVVHNRPLSTVRANFNLPIRIWGQEVAHFHYETNIIRLTPLIVAAFLVPVALVYLPRWALRLVAAIASVKIADPALHPIVPTVTSKFLAGTGKIPHILLLTQMGIETIASFTPAVPTTRCATIKYNDLDILRQKAGGSSAPLGVVIAYLKGILDPFDSSRPYSFCPAQAVMIAATCCSLPLGVVDAVNFSRSGDTGIGSLRQVLPFTVNPARGGLNTPHSIIDAIQRRMLDKRSEVSLTPIMAQTLVRAALGMAEIIRDGDNYLRLTLLNYGEAADLYSSTAARLARARAEDVYGRANDTNGSAQSFLKKEAQTDETKPKRVIHGAEMKTVILGMTVWYPLTLRMKEIASSMDRPTGLNYAGGMNQGQVDETVCRYIELSGDTPFSATDFSSYDTTFKAQLELAVNVCASSLFSDSSEASRRIESEVNLPCYFRSELNGEPFKACLGSGTGILSGASGTHMRGTLGNFISSFYCLLRSGIPAEAIIRQPGMLGLAYGDDALHALQVISEGRHAINIDYTKYCAELGLKVTSDEIYSVSGEILPQTPAAENCPTFLGRAYPAALLYPFSVPCIARTLAKLSVSWQADLELGRRFNIAAALQLTPKASAIFLYLTCYVRLTGTRITFDNMELKNFTPSDQRWFKFLLNEPCKQVPECFVSRVHELEAADLGLDYQDYMCWRLKMATATTLESFVEACRLYEPVTCFGDEDIIHHNRTAKPWFYGVHLVPPQLPADILKGKMSGTPLLQPDPGPFDILNAPPDVRATYLASPDTTQLGNATSSPACPPPAPVASAGDEPRFAVTFGGPELFVCLPPGRGATEATIPPSASPRPRAGKEHYVPLRPSIAGSSTDPLTTTGHAVGAKDAAAATAAAPQTIVAEARESGTTHSASGAISKLLTETATDAKGTTRQIADAGAAPTAITPGSRKDRALQNTPAKRSGHVSKKSRRLVARSKDP